MRRIASLASRMSAHTKIVGAIAAIAVIAGAAGAFAVIELRSITNQFVDQVFVAQDAALHASELQSAFQLQHQEWKNVLIRGADPATFSAETAAIQADAQVVAVKEAELEEALARLGSSDSDALLRSFDASYAIYMTSYAQASQAIIGPQGFDPAAADAVMIGKDRPAQAALASLSELLAGEADTRSASAAAAARRGLVVVLFAVSGAFAAAIAGLVVVRRYGQALEVEARQASVLNRFTEVTSFAADDRAVSALNLEALALLVQPDGAVTHVLNRSKNRGIPEASRGETVAEMISLNALARCAGVVRGALHVTDDLQAPLSVHCPVYPASQGTVACVPLNSGEWVGTVHLHWARPDALPLAVRSSVVRVAEHAALAIGNRRLLATLQRQASTDARTGLANTRAFDDAVEEALAARAADQTVAVLMLDLDHFKGFNDRYGHPAGDEALRIFAEILRSCVRDGDLAARYGGEEFAILLPGVSVARAGEIAEKIRAQTEQTTIAIAPGITDRITVSIGIAIAPAHALERVTLVRLADEALYQAKDAGRNQVRVVDGEGEHTTQPTAAIGDDQRVA